MKKSSSKIYHERQVKSLCALHALNNLFQDSGAFRQSDLDGICSRLSPNAWVNPHKSVLGLGNYDINVIMTALQSKQYEAVWFDKRKDPSDLNFSQIYGFILNIPTDCKLGWLALPMKRKHWVAVRRLPPVTQDPGDNNTDSSVSSQYYNLDSKLEGPESIGDTEDLIAYLREELKSNEKELFLVVTSEVGSNESWRRGSAPTVTSASLDIDPLPSPRKTSADSGVMELLSTDLQEFKDINVVDLDKEEMFRRQSSGVWSDLNN